MYVTRARLLVGALALLGCSDTDEGPVGAPRDGSADAPEATAIDAHFALPPTDAGDASWSPYPPLLSQTGLYSNLRDDVLEAGVRLFQPKYVLWSDGATKRRWIYLPTNERIDTSDMDYWVYPVGTKVWKEFTSNGVRVETRLQYKSGPNKSDWVMIAYAWRADGSDADAVPTGVQDALGTQHDIPSTDDCQFCHGNMKDSLLGFSAIQLSHSLLGITLTDLLNEGRLSAPPVAPFTLPGDSVAEAALGYLHANCGTCHNPASAVYAFARLRLWESTSALTSVETSTAYVTAAGRPNAVLPQLHIIEPGDPDRSELVLRMSTRGTASPTQMPPIGTEVVDTSGVSLVRSWIQSLQPLIPDSGADGSTDAATD